MAKTIALEIDIQGQDELVEATAQVNKLKKRIELNKQLRLVRLVNKLDKALAKNNVNTSVARRKVNELNRELIQKSKI